MQRYTSNEVQEPVMATLYQRYGPVIFAYLRLHTPVREDAEDIIVEVFLAALENKRFSSLTEKEQLAWLWRVARNKVIDYYRRSQRRQSVAIEHVAETMFEDEALEPEQVAMQEEEYARLQLLLKSLPAPQQEVLRLRFTHDLRCAEIAAQLGKREGTIRVMLSRALNLLRTIYVQE